MKNWLIAGLLFVSSQASAQVIGRFTPLSELGTQTGIFRDVAQGVYDIGKGVQVHTVSYLKSDGSKRDLWNTGLFTAWNVNQGAPIYGIFTGPVLYDLNLDPALDSVVQALGLPSAWKPSQYISVSNSVDGWVGLVPHTSGDLIQKVPYGFTFLLNAKFTPADVVAIIQKGL